MPVDVIARMKAAGKTPVDAYSMAVAGGYTGTKEQFEEDVAESETNASNAASSASAAEESAESVLPLASDYAPAYSPSSPYSVGDLTVNDGLLYECQEDIPEGEAFDSSKWKHIPIAPKMTELNRAAEEFKNQTADSIHDTASGAVASFPDGANGAAMDSVVVGITPVQDLHGYDNPWPAGGGKNLLDWGKVSVSSSLNYGMKMTKESAEDTFTISGTLTVNIGTIAPINYSDYSLSGKGYVFLTEHISGDNLIDLNGTYGLRTSTEKAIAVRLVGVSGQEYTETFRVSVYETTPTSWTPYSNICPITGWTGAKVERCGKNLLDDTGILVSSGNLKWCVPGATGNGFLMKKGVTYTVSCNGTGTASGIYIEHVNTNTDYKSAYNASSVTYTPTEDVIVGINFYWGNGRPEDATHIMIELGSTATSYAPYSGNTYGISWQTEAGTVYGGSLDVTTGVLTVTHAVKTFNGSENWTVSNTNTTGVKRMRLQAAFSDVLAPSSNSEVIDAISNIYKALSANNTYNSNLGFSVDISGYLQIYDSSYNTADAVDSYKTWLSTHNLTIIYPLSTPQTYQLTPTQITTLLGENNVWADTGDTAVQYVADTKLYIEQLTKPGDEDMTANANITSGKYFMVGNRLFLSTSAITQGALIIPGTNCTAVSLADALNQLNS